VKKLTIFVPAFLFFLGLASQSVLATATGGSGGAAGVTVGCNSQADCGNITVSSFQTPGGTTYSLSGPLTLNVLTSTPGAEAAAGDDLTPGSETLDFTFNLAVFDLVDECLPGRNTECADFTLTGGINAFTANTTPTGGQLVLTLVVNTLNQCNESHTSCSLLYVRGSGIPAITGALTINFDPNNVTGATAGLSGALFGNGGTSPTPEPGTFSLLGAGLLGFVLFTRRRLAGA
jgi:hypothetical protein